MNSRIGIFSAVLTLATAFSSPAAAGGAYDAMEVAQMGRPGTRIVEVSAQRGDPHPQSWTVVIADRFARGGVREIVVARGVIVSERTPLRGYGDVVNLPTILPSRVFLDSIGAFQAAERQAKQRRIGFDWVDYRLRAPVINEPPVWEMTLFDHMGAEVGTMAVSAYDGAVVRPLQRSASDRLDEPATRLADSEVGRRIDRAMASVGEFVDGVARTTGNAVIRSAGSVEEVFTGERTIGEGDGD